ncbi:hypothetical protein [Paracoccus sanguinis]|uniref:hypothetical protein n=1 Tax=Paracoccus sanguinis TaxID=1545044 RepID=UPI000AC5C595|nr:hypothetical protein [Paracoccus sanguinis]QJD16072.1 hypothetical protein HGN31_03580 [Paracoccus sanguinis]
MRRVVARGLAAAGRGIRAHHARLAAPVGRASLRGSAFVLAALLAPFVLSGWR